MSPERKGQSGGGGKIFCLKRIGARIANTRESSHITYNFENFLLAIGSNFDTKTDFRRIVIFCLHVTFFF